MKKYLLLFVALTIAFGLINVPASVSADEDYAWVLVQTYQFPIPQENNTKDGDWTFSGKIEGNTAELKRINPYGIGYYGSKDENNPVNLHARYSWSSLPSIIQPNASLTVKMEQEAISNRDGYWSISFSPYMKTDSSDLELGYATSSSVNAKNIFPDGTEIGNLSFGYRGPEKAQNNYSVDMVIESFGEGFSDNYRKAVYIGFNGLPRVMGVKYVYEWQKRSTPADSDASPSASEGAEVFDSGSRLMWPSFNCLGYRLFRSKNQGQLGISVTDFYITSTSYADVNVEPNTTYYYKVKPVLAETNPFAGIEEKLGDVIATFSATTGNQIYKPGSFKHFIMLKLDSPNMSVDGVEQEVDPGRGTAPVVIAGRTMVPIRAVVEAMGGEVGWEGATQKIILKARGNTVEMWMGKTDITVNGVKKEMDVAPAAKNERTYVPVRFAAENLNCKVDWINSTKEAVIEYEKQIVIDIS